MKKIFTLLMASFLMLSAYAQTFNGGTWYSLYDTESHEMYTIANYATATNSIFTPTAGQLSFKWNYTKWLVGAFPSNTTHIYTSTDGGSNKTEVGTLTDATWDTEHSENITIGANVNWIKWDRPTGNTHYVHVWNIAIPLAKHILLSGGDNGKTSVSKTFVDAVALGEAGSIRADFRSFLTNGDISITLSSGDAEVFRLGDANNTTGVLATSTAGNSYAVGANACASGNGSADACANGVLANIAAYSFQIYFCPKAVGQATATITITDGTSTATITVTGTGYKAEAVEETVELTMCEGGAAHFRDNDYIAAGSYPYLVEDPIRDTMFTVNVTELQPTYGTDQKTIVAGAEETWNGIDLSEFAVGTHEIPFYTTNVAGCDSTVTLTLTVLKQDAVVVNEALFFCQGGSVEYRDKTYTEAGTDVINVTGAERDTVINVTIVELLPTYGYEEKTIAVGTEETWHGIDLSTYAVGVYDDLMDMTTNVAGCDSIITLKLTVNKLMPVELDETISFCEGDSVEYRGVWYKEATTDEIDIEGETRDTTIFVTVVMYENELVELDPVTVAAGDAVELPEGVWFLGEEPFEGSYETSEADVEAGLEFVQYGKTESECEKVTKLFVTVTSREGIENIFEGESAEKFFRNGTLYIRRGGKLFTAEGREVK